MRKTFLFFIALAIIFASCEQGGAIDIAEIEAPETVQEPAPKAESFFVKNSLWQEVDLTKLPQYKAKAGRAVGGVDDLTLAVDVVKQYNAETDGDQLVILTEDIPIEESPNVTVYFAKAVDGFYEIHSTYIVERSYYVKIADRAVYDAASFGCVIFVDKVPAVAPPPYVDPRTPYEKYSLYLIKVSTGEIIYEEHCDETWTLCDSKDLDTYFTMMKYAYESQARGMGSDYASISGQIYTPPGK